jgi:endonuclease IV
MLAKVIVEFDMKPIIISESPILDIDALRMQEMLREERLQVK